MKKLFFTLVLMFSASAFAEGITGYSGQYASPEYCSQHRAFCDLKYKRAQIGSRLLSIRWHLFWSKVSYENQCLSAQQRHPFVERTPDWAATDVSFTKENACDKDPSIRSAKDQVFQLRALSQDLKSKLDEIDAQLEAFSS